MTPEPTSRTRRAASAALVRIAGIVCAVAACGVAPMTARADAPAGDARPLTIEGQAAQRERLAGRVLLVQTWPAPGPLEDPDLVPARIGMAAIVARDGRVEVWTAAALVADASRIELSAAAGGRAHAARVAEVRDADALARLTCDGGCPGAGDAAPEAAPAEACEDGRPLAFVVPTGHGELVVGHTVVAGPEAPPLEALIIVPGRLPQGAPLFDVQDRPAAVVLRPHVVRTDRVLAAPLTPRPGVAPPDGTGLVPDAPDAPGNAVLSPEAPADLPVMDLR